MRISLIVALDRAAGIGYENRIPWRLSNDLRRFRDLTLGHHLVVGRRTYESIGRALPGRRMIVLSRAPSYQIDQCLVAHSLAEAIRLARNSGETELFIGGGAEIYRLALPLTDRIYLTRVEVTLPADTVFPLWDPSEWTETVVSTHPADEHNEFDSTFLIYDRVS
ncbi:MAG: dihydrofolate reductase [Acidobacteria bacterium]|nr:dihydrofolate reductase [Acidobacteriota bacterium]